MMRKITLLIFLAVFSSSLLFAQDNERLEFLLGKLNDGGKSDYVMIVAHRGDWRNAPENSLQAYKNCIDNKIDGIEIDVQTTKDGELVIMHDQTIDRTTTGKGKVSDYTLAELKSFYLRNALGRKTSHKIPTFREVLKLCKGRLLIQVDKWPVAKEKVLQIAEEEGCLQQIILRGTAPGKMVRETLGDYLNKVIYIPVLVAKNDSDDELLNDFMTSIKTPVIGISFTSESFPVLKRTEEIHNKGYRIWFNSLWAEFNAGHDDDMAEYDLENSYGWLLSKGANIIMTDRPMLMLNYLTEKGKRKE